MTAEIKALVAAFIDLFTDFLALVGVDAEVLAEIEETLNSFNK